MSRKTRRNQQRRWRSLGGGFMLNYLAMLTSNSLRSRRSMDVLTSEETGVSPWLCDIATAPADDPRPAVRALLAEAERFVESLPRSESATPTDRGPGVGVDAVIVAALREVAALETA